MGGCSCIVDHKTTEHILYRETDSFYDNKTRTSTRTDLFVALRDLKSDAYNDKCLYR